MLRDDGVIKGPRDIPIFFQKLPVVFLDFSGTTWRGANKYFLSSVLKEDFPSLFLERLRALINVKWESIHSIAIIPKYVDREDGEGKEVRYFCEAQYCDNKGVERKKCPL